ncbi:unnamed protein product [Lactuca saligna]|uniref:BHLH domain-containing protein n=1 Tax=Lactuca saligna TaxID=75948 RepID=A0AA35YL27_LACSI|nr:unnamed protein product [Lactuca saligna]
MKTDDNNQQGPPRTSGESSGRLWRSEGPHNFLESSHEVSSYFDVVQMLTEVELPSPSPMQATSCTLTGEDYFDGFHQGQSSGTKNKADYIEGNLIEREMELRSKQRDCDQQPGSPSEATKTNITEKRRRNKISERIRTLQTFVPNCNKRHKASILADAIEYIKFLQMQVQMVQSMRIGHMSQGLNMTLARQQSLQVPNFVVPNFPMNPLIGMQHGMPQFGSYFPVNYPIFPTSFFGFRPLLPPNEVHTRSFPWGQPRHVLYPQQQQFPSQTSQSVYSTPSSGTIIPTTSSKDGSSVPGQPLSQTLFLDPGLIIVCHLTGDKVGTTASARKSTKCHVSRNVVDGVP